jgi:hypothetical protein
MKIMSSASFYRRRMERGADRKTGKQFVGDHRRKITDELGNLKLDSVPYPLY